MFLKATNEYKIKKAFINSALNSLTVLQNGLAQVLQRLTKLDSRADDMILHLDAIGADNYSQKMTTSAKKIQKALDAVQAAKDAIDEMIEDTSDSLPEVEETQDELVVEDDFEESSEDVGDPE